MEISTEFSTSAAKKKKRNEFRAILRFLIVENRVEIALYANPTPFAGWKGQTRKGANSSPNANANATGIPSKRARKSPTRERERERERSAQGDHVLRRQVLGVSRRKKEEKKNHVTLPNTINPLTRVFLLPSSTQRETLEDRPGGDPSLRYVRVPSPTNTHTHTHSKRASKTDEKD